MANSAITTTSPPPAETIARAITRCAVCKVDLKGRFVYVDENAARLFGFPGEDLFGRQIIDLVHENSRSTISEILSRRNHYETTFDHSLLTLVGPNGSTVETSAVITLNFNAGNPVNFQFIFKPDTSLTAQPSSAPEAEPYRRFAQYVAQRDITADWRGYLAQLQEFCFARQTCVYIISEDRLEHRSSALVGADGTTSLMAIEDPSAIHRFVADTGETYDFTDDASVRRAVEKGAAAPNEIVARMTFRDTEHFLIRVIFSADSDDAANRSRADRTNFALELTQKLCAPPPRAVEEREEDNVQFSVGLLDGLGIGALMTDSRGRIILYNPTLAALLGLTDVNGDLDTLAPLLHPRGKSDKSGMLAFLKPDPSSKTPGKELLPVELPSGRSALLSYLHLSGNSEDLTSFVTIVPAAKEASAHDILKFCRAALKNLSSTTESSTKFVDQFESKSAGRLPKDTVADLSRLRGSVHDLADSVQDLSRTFEAAGNRSPLEVTDLNVVIHRIASQINRKYPSSLVRIHTDVMPKITARRRTVTLALENLLPAVAAVIDRMTSQVRISAATTDHFTCDITVAVSTPITTRPPAFEAGVLAARLLLMDIGGNLVESVSDKQTQFILTIPLKSDLA